MTMQRLVFEDEGIANESLYRVEDIPRPDGFVAQVMVRRFTEIDVIGYLPDAQGWHVNVGVPDR